MPTNDGVIDDFFDINKEKLGEGGFGAVRKATDKRTKMDCAVKSIRKSDADQVVGLKVEIEIMRCLDHPNIVRFIETFEDKRCVYIVLELCEGGELFDCVVQAGRLTERIGGICVKHMLLAVNYLHQNFIMHRDLKPENWLLATKQEVGVAPLKLIDFGISKRFEPGIFSTTKAGTPNYVAPEVLNGKYDEKSDLWSLGVIMYVMFCGKHPFAGKNVQQILKAVKNGTVDYNNPACKKLSSGLLGIVKACLQKNTSVRPSAQMAMANPWFVTASQPAAGSADMTKLEVGGLEAFAVMNKVKRAAITVIATQLSNADITRLRDLFMNMDQNGDGTLTVSELVNGMKSMEIDMPKDLDKILQGIDSDGSGVIDYTEFLAATLDKKLYNQEQVVWNAFKKFDLDGSGTIDKEELEKVLGSEEIVDVMHVQGEKSKLLEIFATIDKNNDGMIDFNEFFEMMCQAEDQCGQQKVGGGFDAKKSGKKKNLPKAHSGGRRVGLAGPRSLGWKFDEYMKDE